MKKYSTFIFVFILVWGGLLLDSGRVSAEPQSREAYTDSLNLRIVSMSQEVKALEAQLIGLSRADSMIIDHEIEYAQLRILDDVFQLIDFLAKNYADTPLRQEELNLLETIPPAFVRIEDDISKHLGDVRKNRDKIPTSKIGQFEEELADLMGQIDRLQGLQYDFLMAGRKLDYDSQPLENHLKKASTQRTRILIGRLRLALHDRTTLLRKIVQPAAGEDAELLYAADLRVSSTVASLRHLIALMKKLELDTTTHEAFLIQSTGEFTSSDLTSGAVMSYLRNTFFEATDFLRDNGFDIILKILLVIVLVVGFNYLGHLVAKIAIASIDASNFRPSILLRNMIQSMTQRLILFIGILIALSQLGISLGPMLAGLGVAGFIVGFALQDTLANFASGIMILFYRPFDVGDMVETGTVFGKVKHMSLVSTLILTIDNQTLVVPNSMIWGNVIKNVTSQNVRRVDMVFGISYTDDIPKVENLLMEILKNHEMVLKTPEPMVKLHELGDSSVDFVVRPWVRTENYWDVHWDVTREVKMRFDAEGVSIPFPQRDVHLFGENKED